MEDALAVMVGRPLSDGCPTLLAQEPKLKFEIFAGDAEQLFAFWDRHAWGMGLLHAFDIAVAVSLLALRSDPRQHCFRIKYCPLLPDALPVVALSGWKRRARMR